MPTVREILERERGIFGTVPSIANDFVCHYCLGPVPPEYDQCYGCLRLLLNAHEVGGEYVYVPREIRDRIVPATTVLNPSTWYSYLATYKRGRLEDYGPVLAALAFAYLGQHTRRIAELLGGPHNQLTVVPSKRGYVFGDQPLVKALSMVQPLRDHLGHTLVYVPGATWGRSQYHPEVFRAGPARVRGKRIVVLEDAWVTGATAVSAAGALLREGAASVVILPLARVVNRDYLPDPAHPYRSAMAAPYNPDHWPRDVEAD